MALLGVASALKYYTDDEEAQEDAMTIASIKEAEK